MKQRLSLILVSLFLCIGTALAQMEVKGTVVSSEDHDPIVGATVKIAGENKGVITDYDGNFQIKVPSANTILEFSYIGMETRRIKAEKNMPHVVLTPDNAQLDEVMVVAYGSAKKSTITGAVSSIKSDQIDVRPVSNVSAALEGTTSGVQINNSIGDPTVEPDIIIRGVGTVNGTTAPLYVVDGVPYNGSLNSLNPADIESISVLKDAASCALYGNRASNGVILVTTKRGRSGKGSFEFKASLGVYQRGTPEYDRLAPKEWMEAFYETIKNGLMAEGAGISLEEATAEVQNSLISKHLYTNVFDKKENELFDANGKMTTSNILSGYADDLDWYKQGLRNGMRNEYLFSGNSSSDKGNYYFSIGYLNNEGYVKNSSFERITGRLNVNITPRKWIAAGLNLNASHEKSLNSSSADIDNSNSYTNIFMYARNIAPIYPVHLHNEDGSYALDADGNKQYDGGSTTRKQYIDRHVLWENEMDRDRSTRNTVDATAYADIFFLKDFTFSLKGNLDLIYDNERTYDNSTIGNGLGAGGRTKQITKIYKTWDFQQQLRWTHDFGQHNVDVLLGHENYSWDRDYTYAFKTKETFANRDYLSNFSELASLDGYADAYRTESYLGRVRYNFADRYNVEASFRRDGSSRFHKDKRWGNFGSVGANWVISKEAFMRDVKWVNYLKLRGDWGQVGNDAGSGYYAWMPLYTTENYNSQGAYYLSQNAATELQWETSESFGVAIESRLFDRWNFAIEYYNKRNKDLIFDVYQPLSAGATSSGSAESVMTQNLGVVRNHGIEINTDVDIYRSKDWKVNFGLNLTTLNNKILTLPEQNRKDGILTGNFKYMEGRSRYDLFVYTFAGIDQMTGNSMYKADLEKYYYVVDGQKIGNQEGTDITKYVTQINGNAYVNNTTYALREYHGNAIASVYGSFNASVSWKSLTLSALFTYSLGGKAFDGVYQDLLSCTSTPSALHADVVNSWKGVPAGMTEDSPNRLDLNGLARLDYSNTYNNATSSRFLISRNYLVLKNLFIGYSFPKKWVNYLTLEDLNLSFACENVFTCTARRGLNSQQTYSGSQYNASVPARTFIFSLSVKL
ncbi:MAG: SusC/RagA family TonB-linked outer membrane protein [Bacteroidaceae bacterium]|nr:SusC/RagA family TonB-linked outer membrane protein [Bacteroidaceae bacterium]